MFNFQFHSLSFWLGFLAASLFWWLAAKLRPYVKKIRQGLKDKAQVVQEKRSLSAEQVQRQNTLELVQKQHLAATLFSLDEILIPPRLLAPPPMVRPGENLPSPDIVRQALPYMPDWPALALEYQAPTLTLGEALQGGANLALIGPPGSGKTVTLAHTASQIARQETDNEDLNQLVPLYLSAANLLPHLPAEDPVAALVSTLQANPTPRAIRQLPELIQTILENDLALLLVDGLDELPPKDVQSVTQYLGKLMGMYPSVRVVVAASDQYFDGLLGLGLAPLAVAGWGRRDRVDFAQRWGHLWGRYAAPQAEEEMSIDPLLLNGWLFGEPGAPTPLEFTLKVWAVYAGDVLGPSSADALESHLRRMTANIKKNPIPALINIAWQAVKARQTTFSEEEAQAWVKLKDYAPSEEEEGKTSPLGLLISSLLENGFLATRSDGDLSFRHIAMAGYLAAQSTDMHPDEVIQELVDQPDWAFKRQTLYYMAAEREIGTWIREFTRKDNLLARELLQAGQWLSTLPKGAQERQSILKAITNTLNDTSKPLEVKARAASVLATTGDPQAGAIFQYLLKSAQSETRQVAALGSGFIRDTGAVKALAGLLGSSPEINQAACLALVNIGTPPALDAVAEALLTGSEQLRRAAAEALANHPQEGHPTLQEGSAIDDILVRHAAVYGLRRVNELWATHILEKMRVEEGEWIVRDAAKQAVEDMKIPPASPSPLPSLEDTPWLIAFAGEEGVGISAGASSQDMLLKALRNGSEEQQLAALSLIRRKGIANVFPDLYHALYGGTPSVSTAAFDALWHLAGAGAEIPDPAMFGLG